MNNSYTTWRTVANWLMGAALLLCGTLTAQTNYGAFQDNNFLNANNWTNGLPAPGNDGTIVGGVTANINTALTVSYTLTSFGTINANAAVTVNGSGALNNFAGSNFNIGAAGSLTNNGAMNQQATLTVAAGGTFTNGNSATYLSGGSAVINNAGTVNIGGNFSNFGTINNNASLTFTAGTFGNNTLISNAGTLNFDGGTLTNLNGANVHNLAGATFNHKNGASIINNGTLTNSGTFANNGSIANGGIFVNEGLFNNNLGGNISNTFRLNNTAAFNNNQGLITNGFELNNTGVFSNNAQIENNGTINNQAGGAFTNGTNGKMENKFGSSIQNANIFGNLGEIISVGTIANSATFTNGGTIHTNTGGSIQNTGNFINNNLLSNLEVVNNTGIFANNGTLQNNSGGVFTNGGDLYNNTNGRISNEFDLVNNQNLFNTGTVENGVRIFNNKFFENRGYLLNIGDFYNNPTGVFENTATGVLENDNGGVFTNLGTLNNSHEIFNLACSSFINKGIINNYYWFTNKGIFFQLGTFNELPYEWMDMDGGIVVAGPTSDDICESVEISLDESGSALVLGTSISGEAFDDCTTLFLTVNNQQGLSFSCANIGNNPVVLELSDRKGNSVKCSAIVTIVDDRSPEFSNCPADVVVVTNNPSSPATWTPPTFTDNCGPVNVTSTHKPGDIFQLGTTNVSYSATDGRGNVSSSCEFKVTVVPQGDCADVTSLRKVNNTNDNCGTWCKSPYVVTFGKDQCFTAGNDLYFIEYSNGTALLRGSIFRGTTRGYAEIHFSGRRTSAPSGSPKYELCVSSGASGWAYYPNFEGTISLSNCQSFVIKRYGPSFQLGVGANLQEANRLGASGWFTFNGKAHGDFNFRLDDALPCQNSIYLEAECATTIGSKWQVRTDANASGGRVLLPPNNSFSYDNPPVGTQDIVTFQVNVVVGGQYRLFVRSNMPDGSGDSYWVRANNGNWVKWNQINVGKYKSFQWDQVGQWDACEYAVPTGFQLNPGSNTIQFAWREPNAALDKIFLTLSGKQPAGLGGNAQNCGTPTQNPLDGKTFCIKSRHSGKVADISGAAQNNGCGLIQWPTHGGNNQKFRFTAVGPNTYTIKATHSNRCLDAFGNGTANGTNVVQWDCHGGNNQKWVVEDAGNGFYFIKNLHNGLYLDVSGNSTADGAKIHLWAKHGGNNQQWSLEECGSAAPPSCNKKALLVISSSGLNTSDAAIRSRLQSLGYNVQVKKDKEVKTSDANDKGLVLISSTINSSYVGTKFRDVAVPVIVWEGWLMDDMRMTGLTTYTHYGATDKVRNMRISNSSHPIAQGASGEITVFSSNQIATWGRPGNGATKIGHIPGQPDRAMIFTYDTGAAMVGMNAPARRVGFFLHNVSATKLNNLGWALFDRTVQWASGCSGGSNLAVAQEVLTLAAVNNDGLVNLYWTNNTGFKNELFILEKSTDGTNWEVLNELDAYRNEDQSHRVYEDFDADPVIGNNYYRVSVTFLDGTMHTSEVQVIELIDIEDFALYPNPAGRFTNLNLESIIGERNVTIRISDWMGRTMKEVQVDEVQEKALRLELDGLKAGTYAVILFREGKRPVTNKLIIF